MMPSFFHTHCFAYAYEVKQKDIQMISIPIQQQVEPMYRIVFFFAFCFARTHHAYDDENKKIYHILGIARQEFKCTYLFPLRHLVESLFHDLKIDSVRFGWHLRK